MALIVSALSFLVALASFLRGIQKDRHAAATEVTVHASTNRPVIWVDVMNGGEQTEQNKKVTLYLPGVSGIVPGHPDLPKEVEKRRRKRLRCRKGSRRPRLLADSALEPHIRALRRPAICGCLRTFR